MAPKKQIKASTDWALTYGDMITLLMFFFVILWSMARLDLEKYEKVAAAMRTTFGTAGGEAIFTVMGGESTSWASAYSRPAAVEMPLVPYDQRDVSAELGEVIASAGLAGEVDVRTHIEGVIVTLSEALIFPPGSAELQPAGREALAQIAPVLAAMEGANPIRVEGHTDDRPTGNPLYPTNWELSAARAISIVRYLEELGIAPERLSAAGYASYHPLSSADDPVTRMQNRRAEIIIVYPLEARAFQVQLLPELGELQHPVTSGLVGY